MKMQKLFGIFGLAMVTMGCAEDVLSQLCIDDDATFDIEEVSVLEDAMGNQAPMMRDRWYDSSQLEVGAAWRVSGVDVLVMIPASQFGEGVNGQALTLELFDTNDPWNYLTLTQSLDINKLDWRTSR